MTDSKNPNEKQPGERKEGKYHYNPGNMSGKTIGDSEQENSGERKEGGERPSQKRA